MSRSDEDLETSEAPETAESGATEETGRNKVLIASVVGIVVLLVVGTVIYLLASGDDADDQADQPGDVPTITGSPAPQTPEKSTPGASVAPPATATGVTGAPEAPPADTQDVGSVADQVATAISGADVTTLNELSCEPGSAGTEETFPADAKAEVVGEPKITGDTATVDLKLTIGQNEPATVPMPLTKKDGRWCIP